LNEHYTAAKDTHADRWTNTIQQLKTNMQTNEQTLYSS